MSDPQPVAFSEADEQLFQKVRNQILGKEDKAEEITPPAPAADVVQTPRQRALWWLLAMLAILGTIASVLGWLDPTDFGDLKPVGLVVLAVIGIAWAIGRFAQNLAQQARKGTRTPGPPPSPWRRFLHSFIWFILLGILLFTPIELGWLIVVLVLHETGHFLGMRYFGYRDVHMFFIPLFGAVVRGEKRGVPGWQEATVLLLGPVPGLVVGCAIYFIEPAVREPILRTGAAWLVTINFLNLLPFEPLDGGKFWNRLLFSRYRWLEAAMVVLATVGLVFVCWGPGWMCLAMSGAFALLVLAPARFKTATAAAALQGRWPDLPSQQADFSEEQWRDLFSTTRLHFSGDAKLLAEQMKNVHIRALQHPESGSATFVLSAVYLAAILLGIVTAGITPLSADTARFSTGWILRLGRPVFPTGSNLTVMGKGDPAWRLEKLNRIDGSFGLFRGKVVFLNLWATWCGPCLAEMPSIEALHEAVKDEGIAMVLVTQEEPEHVRAFVEKKGWQMPIYIARRGVPAVFNTEAIPATFILNRRGEVVFRHVGRADWNTEECRAFLRRLQQE
jgi:thiol-disulfide isomerase/thioredoxin/Zn-dependent protease